MPDNEIGIEAGQVWEANDYEEVTVLHVSERHVQYQRQLGIGRLQTTDFLDRFHPKTGEDLI